MKDDRHHISRRDFVRKASTGIAVMTGALSCSDRLFDSNDRQKAEATVDGGNENSTDYGRYSAQNDGLPRRLLGKTGLEISMLAFGGGSNFLKNPDGEWEPLLQHAIDIGVNYFDTSHDYGTEERYGELLSPIRNDVIITTKFSVSDIEAGVYNEMQKLKGEGTVRFIGFSSMNSATRSRDLLSKLEFDVCMLALNATTYGSFQSVALPFAAQKNMGVLAMKVMRDVVNVAATPKELIQYSLGSEGVAATVIAHYGMDVLNQNVELVKEFAESTFIPYDRFTLEKRLRPYGGPRTLCWARPGYVDGGLA